MATKKQNRRYVVRAVRRALNRSLDFFTKASGNRLNKHGYGAGITPKNVKEKNDDD